MKMLMKRTPRLRTSGMCCKAANTERRPKNRTTSSGDGLNIVAGSLQGALRQCRVTRVVERLARLVSSTSGFVALLAWYHPSLTRSLPTVLRKYTRVHHPPVFVRDGRH